MTALKAEKNETGDFTMSVRKNYLYTMSYQLLTIAFPLVTIPYISRVLGSIGIGIFSYTNSIVQYFILFGMMGISTYGSKVIATVRDEKEQLSRTFFSLYALQMIMTTICSILYLLFIYFGTFEYKTIMYLQGMALLSCLVDCSWFFSGLEKFKDIVIRNTIVKFISLLLLFLLVKTSDDLAMYTIIMTGSTLIGQIILWAGIKEYIKFVPIRFAEITEHFSHTLVYFVPQIAIQVYFVLNKTMIGVLSTESEVGIFDYADKLLKVCLAFITSLGTIMLPKMAYTFTTGNLDKVRRYLFQSLDFSTLIAVPIMFGLAGISFELIPWYLGEEFNRSIQVLLIISPTIFFMAWSGVFGTQYLLPLGKMKVYSISVYIGAAVNLTLNLFLIKEYGAVGASIGTLAAEFFVVLTQLIAVREQIAFKKILFKSIDYFIAGLVMLFVVRVIGNYLGVKVLTTILQIGLGAITYLLIVCLIEYMKKDGLVLNEIQKVLATIRQRKSVEEQEVKEESC